MCSRLCADNTTQHLLTEIRVSLASNLSIFESTNHSLCRSLQTRRERTSTFKASICECESADVSVVSAVCANDYEFVTLMSVLDPISQKNVQVRN